MAVKLTGQNVLEFLQMDESTARQLLRNRLVDQRLMDTVDDTTISLEQLTFLPLAIFKLLFKASSCCIYQRERNSILRVSISASRARRRRDRSPE